MRRLQKFLRPQHSGCEDQRRLQRQATPKDQTGRLEPGRLTLCNFRLEEIVSGTPDAKFTGAARKLATKKKAENSPPFFLLQLLLHRFCDLAQCLGYIP